MTQPTSQVPNSHSSTRLILLLRGGTRNTFSNFLWRVISIIIVIIKVGALAKVPGLNSKAVELSQGIETGHVVDYEVLDGVSVLRKSVEGSFEGVPSF